MNGNKTTRASDSRSAAPEATALLILGYLASVYWFFSFLFGALVMDYGVETPPLDRLLNLSAFYLMLALVIITHAWYLYRSIKRKMGSEGPRVGVGIIAPTVLGYIIFVLGPFFGFYPNIVAPLQSFFFEFGFLLMLFGPVNILLFYLLVESGESAYLKKKEAQTSQNEKETEGK